ncbi:MAG: hypothetical protein AAGL10_02310 [Pseudomonadota bacterium]
MRWNSAVKWDENARVGLVYPTRNLAFIFPKSGIGEDRWTFMQTRLVESGLKQKGKLRK